MAEKLSVYKCAKCGNIVEVLHAGGGALVCCGEPMKQLVENTTDAAQEKHVPVFDGEMVKVGSVAHPMADDHYIEWIEMIRDNGKRVCHVFLNPGEKPEVAFCEPEPGDVAREFCNKHGLWKVAK